MSACPNPPEDAPQLRLFPDSRPTTRNGVPTLAEAYAEYVEPELTGVVRSTRGDYRRFLQYWSDFEIAARAELPPLDKRTRDPWSLMDIDSRACAAFMRYLLEYRNLSGSTAKKALGAVKRILLLASEDYPVHRIRTRAPRANPAAKCYIDELETACLWSAADAMTWPPQGRFRTFEGTGMPPGTFWRAILILMRCYGMRVQDLVAYQMAKKPAVWGDVTFDARTPNPEGRMSHPLGWLRVTPKKTENSSRVSCYLPLSVYTRAALDRLLAAAREACGGDPPPTRPILPCPRSGYMPKRWKELQQLANVSRLTGKPYQLEDFRKTAATYLEEHQAELSYLVCGWSRGRGSAVAHDHYITSERKLVKYLPTAPMPACFKEWLPAGCVPPGTTKPSNTPLFDAAEA